MDASVAQCLHTASGTESGPLKLGTVLVLSVAMGRWLPLSGSSVFSSLFDPMLVLHLPFFIFPGKYGFWPTEGS